VVNLTWKLQAVLAGKASEALLDTYATERREHVRRLTSIVKDIGRVICERDPEAARARDSALLAQAGGTVKTQPRQDLVPPITTGLLSPSAHAANGTIFPQPRVRYGAETVLLDQVTGCGFRVVASERCDLSQLLKHEGIAALGVRLVRIADGDRVPGHGDRDDGDEPRGECFIETEGVVTRWFQRHGCSMAIVRPDHYVYGVAHDTAGVLEQLTALRSTLLEHDRLPIVEGTAR